MDALDPGGGAVALDPGGGAGGGVGLATRVRFDPGLSGASPPAGGVPSGDAVTALGEYLVGGDDDGTGEPAPLQAAIISDESQGAARFRLVMHRERTPRVQAYSPQ